MWVRRASIVGLIPQRKAGRALDLVYEIARTLHPDDAGSDSEGGRVGAARSGQGGHARLERYLRANGASIPRTTVRYAIERFAAAKRRVLLAATRANG